MIVINRDKTLLTFGERSIEIWCHIRDHTTKPDAHPENINGALYPMFYQPMPFPSNLWLLLAVEPNNDEYTAPFFLKTNAHQTVTCFDGSVVEDYGYGIHFSTSDTTLGCIRVAKESDLRWLASLVKPGEQIEVL